MTRQEAALIIVRAGLRSARVPDQRPRPTRGGPDEPRMLSEVIPDYEGAGRHRFLYGLSQAAQGPALEKGFAQLSDTDLAQVVDAVAALLPMRLFQCTDTLETHFYEQRGTGRCRVDDTELIELT